MMFLQASSRLLNVSQYLGMCSPTLDLAGRLSWQLLLGTRDADCLFPPGSQSTIVVSLSSGVGCGGSRLPPHGNLERELDLRRLRYQETSSGLFRALASSKSPLSCETLGGAPCDGRVRRFFREEDQILPFPSLAPLHLSFRVRISRASDPGVPCRLLLSAFSRLVFSSSCLEDAEARSLI